MEMILKVGEDFWYIESVQYEQLGDATWQCTLKARANYPRRDSQVAKKRTHAIVGNAASAAEAFSAAIASIVAPIKQERDRVVTPRER